MAKEIAIAKAEIERQTEEYRHCVRERGNGFYGAFD
jgi:hypothetical protein